MRLVKDKKVKVLFDDEWIEGRYLGQETGESETLSFKNGQLVSKGVVKYDRYHVLLPGGLQYATSRKNILPV